MHVGSVCKSLLGEASVLVAGSDSLTECDDGRTLRGQGFSWRHRRRNPG